MLAVTGKTGLTKTARIGRRHQHQILDLALQRRVLRQSGYGSQAAKAMRHNLQRCINSRHGASELLYPSFEYRGIPVLLLDAGAGHELSL